MTTTQNSFFETTFGIEKKVVILACQAGFNSEDIWIAHYISANSGYNPFGLMNLKKSTNSWKSVVDRLNIPPDKFYPEFLTALNDNDPDSVLFSLLSDRILVDNLNVEQADIKKIRVQNGSNKEIILAVFLSIISGRPASDFFNAVRSQNITWGKYLNSFGIEPKDMKKVIENICEKNRQRKRNAGYR